VKITLLEAQIVEYKEEIHTLQDKLEKLASQAIEHAKPTTNINKNNYINVLTPLPNQSEIGQIIRDNLTRQHIIRGQIGIAECVTEYIAKGDDGSVYLVCTDPSRRVFRFKNEFGNVVKDPYLTQFTNMIAEPVEEKTTQILKEVADVDPLYIDRFRELAREVTMLKKDNTEFCRAMSSMSNQC
jgi:hypothetical protein